MANEKRLIDANAYENNIRKLFVSYGDGTYPNDREAMIYDEALVYALYELNEATTVDAVEVVRCKDCKHRHKNDDFVCIGIRDDDFCSYGERRAGE